MKKSLTDLVVALCTKKISKKEIVNSCVEFQEEYSINDAELAILISGNSTDLSLLLNPARQNDSRDSFSRELYEVNEI